MSTISTIIFLLAVLNFAALKEISEMTVPELIHLAEDVTQLQPKYFTEDDVQFYLADRTSSPHQIHLNATESVVNSSKNTIVVVHGWLENHNQHWYHNLTQEYLKLGDYNVIQVDWGKVARTIYVSSAENTKFVGDDIARLIINQKLPPESVHLIGHSLGAHCAGFAGKAYQKSTGNKLGRITALDAAGPYFREFFIDENHRLNKHDAEIVDAIHTDGGVYGYEQPIGTLDVFFNGGKGIQPDCLQFRVLPLGEVLENSFCSHTMSYHYFISMINDKKFTCVKCKSYEDFLGGVCSKSDKYVLSAENVTRDMQGECFVETGRKKAKPIFDIGSVARLFNLSSLAP